MLKKNKELEATNKALQDICESQNIKIDKTANNKVQVVEVRKNLVLINL